MEYQRTKMAKGLPTTLCAANERLQHATLNPLLHLVEVDTASAQLYMQVDVHVQWRVPPLSQTPHDTHRLSKVETLA